MLEQYGKMGCVVTNCPPLSAPENGFFVRDECFNVYNSACGLRCRSGYELNGSRQRICLPNGQWSGLQTKSDMICQISPRYVESQILPPGAFRECAAFCAPRATQKLSAGARRSGTTRRRPLAPFVSHLAGQGTVWEDPEDGRAFLLPRGPESLHTAKVSNK